jgi:hypothetical protein
MLKRAYSCWLKVVLWKFLSISVWNHYASKLDVRVLVFFGWALNHVISAVPNRPAGLRFVRWGRVVLVFFGVLSACRVEPACRFVYV